MPWLVLLVVLLTAGPGRAFARFASRRIRAWLAETHSPRFELGRHFFTRFFDSELIASPEQAKTVAGGALAILVSLSLVYAQAYYHKYRALRELGDLETYRRAELADVLFVITLVMTLIGLFTTLQWPSLFPGLRDYLALASLPVRMRDVFSAKFAALLAFALLAIVCTAALPSVLLPATMGERLSQVPGIFVACSLAALFVFFSLVALQGILLNTLPVRYFPRVSLATQGVLLAALLCALPFVFSVPDLHSQMMRRPPWVLWIPPLWFLGLDQFLYGNAEPLVNRLTALAVGAAGGSGAAALLAYLWSYRRHRRRILESPALDNGARGKIPPAIVERLVRHPRHLAVFAFTAKTLARSRHHRLILTAFAAVALAMITEGFVSLAVTPQSAARHSVLVRQAAIAAPLALSLFILAGFRYLFRLPVELRANWIFRIHQRGHAAAFLVGVARFLLYCGAIPIAVLTLPIEIRLLGIGAGLLAGLMCLLVSLVLVETLLFSFEKIPFTSSYMPGRRPLIETVLRYGVAASLYVTVLSAFIRAALDTHARAAAVVAALAAAWWKAHDIRRTWQNVDRLEFEEALEPAVQVLSIERD